MILGGPRSATTWAANWLTTDATLCLHDPLLEYTRNQLDVLQIPGKQIGISCTGALLFPDWVKAHPCPKVILYREVGQINASLRGLGLDELEPNRHHARMAQIPDALLVPYEHLFRSLDAEGIAKHLGVPWDPYRHDQLRRMRVEPMWRHLAVGKRAVAELSKQILEAR
jgi:hypothetical protein